MPGATLATAAHAETYTGPSSSESPYLVPTQPGVTTTAILTDSDTTVKLWVEGGVAGTTYKVEVVASSTLGRIKEDEVKIKVKEFLGSTQKGATVYSAGTTLSPTWQLATVDYVVTTAATTTVAKTRRERRRIVEILQGKLKILSNLK